MATARLKTNKLKVFRPIHLSKAILGTLCSKMEIVRAICVQHQKQTWIHLSLGTTARRDPTSGNYQYVINSRPVIPAQAGIS